MAGEYSGKAPETWSEKALVAVDIEGGNTILFNTITESVDLDLGEKGFDSIATVGGGRLVKFNPEEDSSCTLEMYPIAAGNLWSTDGSEGIGFYDLLQPKDSTYDGSTTVIQEITNSLTRNRCRLTILWTNDTSITDPTSAISSAYAVLRVSMCGYFTKVTPSFTDKVLKVTANFKAPAFKKDGSSNIQVMSTDDASVSNITQLGAFTSSDNFPTS